MRRRKSTRNGHLALPPRNTIDCTKLFHKDIEEELQRTLEIELEKFNNITNYNFTPMYNKSFVPKHWDNPYKLDNTKFTTIDDMKLKKDEMDQLKAAKFIKIVNELKLIFIGCPKILIIYDRLSSKTYVEKLDKDYITCMDYDPVSGVIIFGHLLGKFTFNKWTGTNIKRIEKIKIEGYSIDAIKDVKFVSGVDVITFLDIKNTSELLIRIPGKSIRYRNKYILESKLEHFEISYTRLGNGEKNNKNKVNTVLIAYTSANDIKFIAFETVYEDDEFKDIAKIRKVTTMHRPSNHSSNPGIGNLFDDSKIDDINQSRYQDSRLDSSYNSKASMLVNNQIRNIILFDNKQWMCENQPYAIIIWGNIIEQYFITPELEFIKSFSVKLDDYILSAYIGSTELLVTIFDNHDISFIYLEKLRYTLDTQKDPNTFIEQKEAFVVSLNDYLIGKDTNNKGVCLITNGMVQYFQIFDWENYIDNLKAQSFYIEALLMLSNLVKGVPTRLHGAFYLDARSATFNLIDINQMENFADSLRNVVKELMVDMVDWLRNKKQGLNLLEICIELLIKTRNFELLYSDFLDVILSNKNKDDKLAEIFIKQLASYLNSNILNEFFSIDFFVKIFDLIDAKQNIEILEKFLFYLVQTFTLKPEILEVLKIMAFNKHMPLFTFFLLLHNPTNKDNLDYMQRQIENCMEIVPLNTEELRDSTNRLFAYLYDLFHSAKLLDIDRNTRKNKNDITKIREVTKSWFLEASQGFFLKMFGPKTIWLLLNIHEYYMIKTPFNITKFNKDEATILTNVQLDFNSFFINLYNTHSKDIFYVLAIFAFATKDINIVVGEFYIVGLMLQILDKDLIKRLKHNKNICFDYFFNHLYDLYYAHRDDLKNNTEFIRFIDLHKEDEYVN